MDRQCRDGPQKPDGVQIILALTGSLQRLSGQHGKAIADKCLGFIDIDDRTLRRNVLRLECR